MKMSIDDLKAYCMEEEAAHRLSCKHYDNASGYTRSKNKDIRTASAVREELLGDYYQQIASILRKYQQLQADYENRLKADMVAMLDKIRAEIEKNAYPIVHGVNSHEKGMTLYGILQILDKYKAESEDKE